MSDRPPLPALGTVDVVGDGRMGRALVARLRDAGVAVAPPLGRGVVPHAEIVLLAVPDAQIAAAAALVPIGAIVGHLSGATTLAPLAHADAFSVHPLRSVTGADAAFDGVPAALSASSDRAYDAALALVRTLGLAAFEVADADRAAYHAAASVAANYLTAVAGFAEELAASAGVPLSALEPLVTGTVDTWQRLGAAAALTGPVARGDDDTVARQRGAVAERTPERLALFDALTQATRDLAASEPGGVAPAPRVVRTVSELRDVLSTARPVRFVPTMGALHEGHLSLLRAARSDGGTVVLSIFVNPTQFDEQADLDAYPRTVKRDLELARTAGVDVVFLPTAAEMYPAGAATSVRVRGPLTETLEGARRGPGHFDGVATIVLSLLQVVRPVAAYFGAKDAQQVAVVRRMVADLRVPVDIVVCPTSREPDGLARSSRNVRLSAPDRERALAISRGLRAATDAVATGIRDAARLCDAVSHVLAEAGVAPEYVAFVDPDTFVPVADLDGPAVLAVAARVGETRLIDNVILAPADPPVIPSVTPPVIPGGAP
ncbi:pantoate--beta-alanine ligase [Microbacterium telephonicum]|uniref:Pantothenate synthetase n=1 Tax=Microbacterium telephonicum TaxID=1714841 RepID=A0A498CKG2_9MICO|nr:pantoate--beta-alanine ligase [Microbacterium telephonicum]